MPSAVAWILWLWLAVSLSVYGYRLVRRWQRRGESGSDAAEEASVGGPAPAGSNAEDRVAARLAAMTPDEAPLPAPEPAGEPEETPAADVAADPAAPGASAPAAWRRPDPGATIAEALRGIDLPAGLTPRIDPGAVVDERRALFATADAGPTSVAAALGEELGRLGYEVEAVPAPDGGHRLRAVRDATVVTATVSPDEAFGGAVVELSV